MIAGSYDPHLLFIGSKSSQNFSLSKLLVNAKRLLIVIGGSAISFALPILRVMNYHGIPTKIVWVIKDFRDVLVLDILMDSFMVTILRYLSLVIAQSKNKQKLFETQ